MVIIFSIFTISQEVCAISTTAINQHNPFLPPRLPPTIYREEDRLGTAILEVKGLRKIIYVTPEKELPAPKIFPSIPISTIRTL
jgi:hypothetical protein